MQLDNYSGQIRKNVPLNKLTTWRIGGPADWVVEANNPDELRVFLREVNSSATPWMVLGNGSNILFSDLGYRGAILILGDDFQQMDIRELTIQAGAGLQLHHLANRAADAGMTGLEPLAGIPGTVGGAAFVNAGAFGCSFLQLCKVINGFDRHGHFRSFDDIHPGYRSGGFPDGCIITNIQLTLASGEPSRIHDQMCQYLEQRRSTQPLSDASAGCTFKNPANTGAGRLIDRLGLKGFQSGRAMISTRHANFIINNGGASATDVIDIIRHVRRKVFAEYRLKLELEVLILDETGARLDPGGELK
ncbi:UDP-N-acetylmuramate dehydrogenase [bacterium]|nr:UDP-N-acetylmuramate dehydrogenase [candidate division CSSED10-310 bacterium]